APAGPGDAPLAASPPAGGPRRSPPRPRRAPTTPRPGRLRPRGDPTARAGESPDREIAAALARHPRYGHRPGGVIHPRRHPRLPPLRYADPPSAAQRDGDDRLTGAISRSVGGAGDGHDRDGLPR